MDNYVSAMHSASSRIRRTGSPSLNGWYFPVWARNLTVATAVLCFGAVGLEWATKRNRTHVEPAFAVSMIATRGEQAAAKAPAGRPLQMQLDLAGLPADSALRLEMVDERGGPVWRGVVISHNSQGVAVVPEQSAGLYFLRVYSVSGQLLREYGLEIEGR
ncbi:MAG TPA: hypothetical protein VMH81_12845 [Bryobacteraceae bacterium]|nr:hypothetical protein [Bryobacteraceae bacterium]